jgi:hypothetical protein
VAAHAGIVASQSSEYGDGVLTGRLGSISEGDLAVVVIRGTAERRQSVATVDPIEAPPTDVLKLINEPSEEQFLKLSLGRHGVSMSTKLSPMWVRSVYRV